MTANSETQRSCDLLQVTKVFNDEFRSNLSGNKRRLPERSLDGSICQRSRSCGTFPSSRARASPELGWVSVDFTLSHASRTHPERTGGGLDLAVGALWLTCTVFTSLANREHSNSQRKQHHRETTPFPAPVLMDFHPTSLPPSLARFPFHPWITLKQIQIEHFVAEFFILYLYDTGMRSSFLENIFLQK